MTCWSCLYYRPDGCLQNMRLYRETNAGPQCPWFEYEPGSDEQIKQEEDIEALRTLAAISLEETKKIIESQDA